MMENVSESSDMKKIAEIYGNLFLQVNEASIVSLRSEWNANIICEKMGKRDKVMCVCQKT